MLLIKRQTTLIKMVFLFIHMKVMINVVKHFAVWINCSRCITWVLLQCQSTETPVPDVWNSSISWVVLNRYWNYMRINKVSKLDEVVYSFISYCEWWITVGIYHNDRNCLLKYSWYLLCIYNKSIIFVPEIKIID